MGDIAGDDARLPRNQVEAVNILVRALLAYLRVAATKVAHFLLWELSTD